MKDLVCALLGAALLAAQPGASRGTQPTAVPTPIPPPDWPAILAEPARPVVWTEPRDEVVWGDDVSAALERAQASGRPVFATLRCLPCDQCSEFDQDVLEAGPRLDPLLRRFETVRLTDASDVDLRVLPMQGFQDFDLSWWGWFLSPAGRVYGVFGGKDHVSDTTRISVEALAHTLRRVLDHHHDPRRGEWNVDGPAPETTNGPSRPRDLPGYPSWARRRPEVLKPDSCLHCHQVAEIVRQPALDAGTFDKRRDLAVWPLPENVGLVLDRDDGLLVKRVVPGSPAEAAGMRALDVLAVADDRRLFGQADFRGVLHRGPKGSGVVEVWWLRRGVPMRGMLELEDGWRATELGWRMSISQGNVGGRPGFWPLALKDPERRRFGIPRGRLAIKPWYGPEPEGPAFEAGIRPDRALVAVDGESPPLFGRDFLTWFRLRHDPGDVVEYTLVDPGGERHTVRFAALRPGE